MSWRQEADDFVADIKKSINSHTEDFKRTPNKIVEQCAKVSGDNNAEFNACLHKFSSKYWSAVDKYIHPENPILTNTIKCFDQANGDVAAMSECKKQAREALSKSHKDFHKKFE